jgi:DnaJ-class molecular chaperone
MAALVIIALLVGFGYFISLRIHPLRRCSLCKGSPGRHSGGFYTYAFRRCRACGGTGRKDRLGTKIFFGGTNNTGIYGPR